MSVLKRDWARARDFRLQAAVVAVKCKDCGGELREGQECMRNAFPEDGAYHVACWRLVRDRALSELWAEKSRYEAQRAARAKRVARAPQTWTCPFCKQAIRIGAKCVECAERFK